MNIMSHCLTLSQQRLGNIVQVWAQEEEIMNFVTSQESLTNPVGETEVPTNLTAGGHEHGHGAEEGVMHMQTAV